MNDTLESIRTGGSTVGSTDTRKSIPSVPFLAAAAAVVAAEALLMGGFIAPALAGHALAVLCCLFGARWTDSDRAALAVLVPVALLRLVNLGMPRALAPAVLWVPMVYLALLPGLYFAGKVPGTASPQVGLRTGIALALPAVVFGAILGEVEFRLLAPAALASDTLVGLGLLAFGTVFVVAPVEELLFRGLLQGTLVERFGQTPGVLVAAIVYGAVHASGGAVGAAFAGGFGLLLGVLYARSESLALVTVVHAVAIFYLYGYRPHATLPWLSGVV